MILKRKPYNGENNPFYGKTHSEETKQQMRKPKSNTENMKKSEETKVKISESMQGKKNAKGKTWKQEKINCPHCNKIGGTANMKRYHFENCKKVCLTK